MRPSMFNAGGKLRPASVTRSQTSREIDLRAEFDSLIFGPDADGHRHGHPILIRRMRRGSDGRALSCTCRNEEKQGNPSCPYCLGEGTLWDEEWTMCRTQYLGPEGGRANKYVRMPHGQIKTEFKVFFLRYDMRILYDDRIVEVALDEEGKIIMSSITNSFIRTNIYKPQTIDDQRSDNGRKEFIAVYCSEYDAVRNDNPMR